mmetsp:Transcript_155876/g.286971  ORF Transcript_155876/g.286971 Transcript_155876/m.286971 type:complete len:330 (+) Transcript_155876:400-1389(+)
MRFPEMLKNLSADHNSNGIRWHHLFSFVNIDNVPTLPVAHRIDTRSTFTLISDNVQIIAVLLEESSAVLRGVPLEAAALTRHVLRIDVPCGGRQPMAQLHALKGVFMAFWTPTIILGPELQGKAKKMILRVCDPWMPQGQESMCPSLLVESGKGLAGAILWGQAPETTWSARCVCIRGVCCQVQTCKEKLKLAVTETKKLTESLQAPRYFSRCCFTCPFHSFAWDLLATHLLRVAATPTVRPMHFATYKVPSLWTATHAFPTIHSIICNNGSCFLWPGRHVVCCQRPLLLHFQACRLRSPCRRCGTCCRARLGELRLQSRHLSLQALHL